MQFVLRIEKKKFSITEKKRKKSKLNSHVRELLSIRSPLCRQTSAVDFAPY